MAEKPTLLIVDDEKTTRDGLRAALEEHFADDAARLREVLGADPLPPWLAAGTEVKVRS